ncbi:hypothetical protein [Streptomyces sp. NPDC057854]|uniref:hypothetical protein n=1 Tax=unclassified Streptomyces TaxID=2593676 RepID=UPI0036877F31
MTNGALPDATLLAGEEGLLRYLRTMTQGLPEAGLLRTAGWAYRSPYHLLLAEGRRHDVGPLPDGTEAMPARHCYRNAALYARSEGFLYAEGFAQPFAGDDLFLSHAWVVRPDGTALDPTWEWEAGRAYVGIAVADPDLWPYAGGGLLQDVDRTVPLLRDGFRPGALADVGRPLLPAPGDAALQ